MTPRPTLFRPLEIESYEDLFSMAIAPEHATSRQMWSRVDHDAARAVSWCLSRGVHTSVNLSILTLQAVRRGIGS